MLTELLDEDGEHGGSSTKNTTSAQMNLSEPVITQSGRPLAFWQENKSLFAALVQQHEAVLCTGVDSSDSLAQQEIL